MSTDPNEKLPDRPRAESMRRQQFIVAASRMLAESLDYETTLQSVAQLAVPDIADWCVVDLLQADGTMARVATAHKDRSRGQSFMTAVASDPDRLRMLRRLGLHSWICAPLVARGCVLGTLTFVSEGSRAFEQDDVVMAEELARRSAMAIDNARLYEEAQRVVRSRDQMLAIISQDFRPPLAEIMMAAEVQISSAPDTDAGRHLKEAAEASRRAAQHICRLIDSLNDIASHDQQASPGRVDEAKTQIPDVLAVSGS